MHPEKWRETIELSSLYFKNFKIKNIIGYPHAGNDIFHVEGLHDNNICKAYIKVERQKGADILNEVEIINKLPFEFKPHIIEFSDSNPRYIITKEILGERLSTILGSNDNLESLNYMKKYGAMLAKFHHLKISCNDVKHRSFFDIPKSNYFKKIDLVYVEDFLKNCPPKNKSKCFVHGDFHYANILWKDKEISAVLDYELSGYGIREFDIAWSILLRPSQKFLNTIMEIESFLEGYSQLQSYSKEAFIHYFVLIASRFYEMGDEDYKKSLQKLMECLIGSYKRI